MVWEENDRAGRRLVGLQDIHLQQKWAVYFLNFTYNFEKKTHNWKSLSCYGKIVQSEVEQLGCISLGKIWIRIELRNKMSFSKETMNPRTNFCQEYITLQRPQGFPQTKCFKGSSIKKIVEIQNQKVTLLDGKLPYPILDKFAKHAFAFVLNLFCFRWRRSLARRIIISSVMCCCLGAL